MPGSRQLRAGRGPAVDDLAVPVDLEPVDERVGDDAADAFDGGELVARGGADRIDRPEPLRERPRGDRPDVTDVERDEEPPEILRLGDLEVGEQLRRGGRQDVIGVAVERPVGVEGGIGLLALTPERRARVGCAVLEQTRKPGLGVADDDVDREQVFGAQVEQPGLGDRAAASRGAPAGSAQRPTPRRAPRCRGRRASRCARRDRAPAPGTSGRSGSAGRCRPPSRARAESRTPGSSAA